MSAEPARRPGDEQYPPNFHRPALELLHRLGGDKLLVDIIDVFTTSAPRLIVAARAGADEGDGDRVRLALHSLKSSAGQLGAARMQRLCGEGELVAASCAGPALSRIVDGVSNAYAEVLPCFDAVKRTGLAGIRAAPHVDTTASLR